MKSGLFIASLLVSVCVFMSFTYEYQEDYAAGKKYVLPVPTGFSTPNIPSDNYLTYERVELGKRLFYDPLLSSDKKLSCGSCHAPKHSFGDATSFSLGVNQQQGQRNTMPLINLAWSNSFMWDGGVASLELQVMNPLTNHKEMNAELSEVIQRLNDHELYPRLFKRAYGTRPDAATLFKAIASFERTLISANSKYDRFYYGKQRELFNASELKGYYLFNSEKTHCTSCHTGFNFTNNTFQNNGLFTEYTDQGRHKVTFKEEDKGKFKVPTLRNIAITAPYMHDGSMTSLEEVVDHYNSGGKAHPNKSQHVHNNDSPPLTEEEKQDLINFLKTLTDTSFVINPAFIP